MENILTNKQTEALNFFNKHGYLVIDAPRRSGKTTLLKEIVKLNPDKKIAILCNGYNFFLQHYKEYKNCVYIEDLDWIDESYDLIIGDERYLEPTDKIKTACAMTKKYITLRWNIEYINSPVNLKEIKAQLSEYHYQCEFGQYEK